MKNINLRVDDYSARVLEVFKAAHGLSNKSEAFNRMVRRFGPMVLQPELNPEFAKSVLKTTKDWEGKHQFKRKMTLEDLDSL